MMKHNFSSPAIALIVAAVFFGTSAFHGQGNSPANAVRCCLPNAQDLVSRDGKVELLKKKLSVPIYKVPVGKYFILTDLHIERVEGPRYYAKASLVQRQEGKDLVRIDWRFLKRHTRQNSSQSADVATAPLGNPTTGLVFSAKSLLLLALPQNGKDTVTYAYHLRGYLTDR